MKTKTKTKQAAKVSAAVAIAQYVVTAGFLTTLIVIIVKAI